MSALATANRRDTAFRLVFRPASHGPACWLALPEWIDTAAPPLVAVHGIRRAAEEQAALFGARAAAAGRVVVAPLLDADYPGYQRLGAGSRADLGLLALMTRLRDDGIIESDRFELFGFSGGAQFAHRFAMLDPHRVTRLCIASAGWYTFPDSAPYPYGLGDRPGRRSRHAARMRESLDAFLALPMRVCVGARDSLRDSNTRSGDAIDSQQGRNRRARASRWVEAVAIAAAIRGIVPRIRLSVLPDCGHHFARCMRRGGLGDLVLPAAGAVDRAPAQAAEGAWSDARATQRVALPATPRVALPATPSVAPPATPRVARPATPRAAARA